MEEANEDVLFQMHRDLVAPHRSPNPYDDAEYTDTEDPKQYLKEHLSHINTKLEQTESIRDLSGIRTQLLAFSFVIGDSAYFGFFGQSIQTRDASAGDYRVVLTVTGNVHHGIVSVREDPILMGN